MKQTAAIEKSPRERVFQVPSLLARLAIRLYQFTLSPLIHLVVGAGGGCRFEPTCSTYALESFRRFPFFKALGLSVKRLARCHPFCEGGYDPPPNHAPRPVGAEGAKGSLARVAGDGTPRTTHHPTRSP